MTNDNIPAEVRSRTKVDEPLPAENALPPGYAGPALKPHQTVRRSDPEASAYRERDHHFRDDAGSIA